MVWKADDRTRPYFACSAEEGAALVRIARAAKAYRMAWKLDAVSTETSIAMHRVFLEIDRLGEVREDFRA